MWIKYYYEINMSSSYSLDGCYMDSRLPQGQTKYIAKQFIFPTAECNTQKSYNQTKVNMDRPSGLTHTLLEKKIFQLKRNRLVSRWLTSMIPNIITNTSFWISISTVVLNTLEVKQDEVILYFMGWLSLVDHCGIAKHWDMIYECCYISFHRNSEN